MGETYVGVPFIVQIFLNKRKRMAKKTKPDYISTFVSQENKEKATKLAKKLAEKIDDAKGKMVYIQVGDEKPFWTNKPEKYL